MIIKQNYHTNKIHDQEEYLISYANLKGNLIKYQKDFLDLKSLNNFYVNRHFGFPQCLPLNIKYFDYSKSRIFKIDKKEFSKKIFETKNLNYVGVKKFFRYGTYFASEVKLKEKYENKFYKYLNQIIYLKKKVSNLKKKHKKICSMQIRNVPHLGHEAIFKFLINKFDLVVLNPIFGIKKKNDFSSSYISIALTYIENKYKKIRFLPFPSNFYYAGPREALHHMNLREMLGFNFFYIGRDHAGAENLYPAENAVKIVKKFSRKFKIKSVTSAGGFFCKKCKKYLIKYSCRHKALVDISGTQFRSCLRKRKLYIHADENLQKKLFN
mgnify:CR=1 FL=1